MNNAFVQSMKTIAESVIHKAGFDKTRSGKIVAKNQLTNTYGVKIDGNVYNNVRVANDATYNVGDTVKVNMPCNQPSQMYITASIFSDASIGKKIGHAQSLIDAMDAQLEDVKEIDGHIYQLNIVSTYSPTSATHTAHLLKDGAEMGTSSFSSNLRWYLMKSTGKTLIQNGGATLNMAIDDYMFGMALVLEWVNNIGDVLLRKQIVLFDNSRLGEKITEVNDTATRAEEIATNETQYFWFSSDSTDNGVHITQIVQDEFLAQPSGYNLLANTYGLAMRDGLSELAQFTNNGIFFNGYVDGQWQRIASYGATSIVIGSTSTNKPNVAINTNGINLRSGTDVLAVFNSEGTSFKAKVSGTWQDVAKYMSTYTQIGSSQSGQRNVYITPNNGISMRVGTQAFATFNTNAIVFKDSNNRQTAYFGSASTQIGRLTSGYVHIHSSGMNVYGTVSNTVTDVAYFGSTARIGINNTSRFLMNATSLQAYNSDNKKYFEVSASGMKFGTDLGSTVATTANVATAKADAATDATTKANAAQEAAAADATTKANNAAKTATNYLQVTTSGLKVYDGTNTTNYALLNSSGMQVYKANTQVASFGADVILGQTGSSNQNIQINASGGIMFRKGGTTYGKILSNSSNQLIIKQGSSNYTELRIKTNGISIGTYDSYGDFNTGIDMGTTNVNIYGIMYLNGRKVIDRTHSNMSIQQTTINLSSISGGGYKKSTADITMDASHQEAQYKGRCVVGWYVGGSNTSYLNVYELYVNQSNQNIHYGVRSTTSSATASDSTLHVFVLCTVDGF